jgi:hypothetical protein
MTAPHTDLRDGQPLIARVLGPVAFSSARTVMLVMAALCLAIRVPIEMQDTGAAHERLFMTRCMLLIAVVMLMATMAFGEAARVYQRQAEQSLVRLSAAAPVAGSINRVLARYLLVRFASMWIWCSAVTVAMLLVLGANGGEAWRAAVAFSVTLALAGLPLRDYSRGKAANVVSTVVFCLATLAAMAAGVAAMRGGFSGGAWAGLGLASVALALLFAARRWKVMVGAAPAFPAGRKR